MFRALINLARKACRRRSPRGTKPASTDPVETFVDFGSFDFAGMLAEGQKERNRLRENPPPCGSVIRYVQDGTYKNTYGEFLFAAADIEHELKSMLRENSHLTNDDEGAILNWVQGRDESVTEPSVVPSTWSRFRYVADNLVRAGKAEIYCTQCKIEILPDQISIKDDRFKRGWNYDRVACQHGHNLLVVDSVHLMMG